MSTKTTFKRIALVAVAALGFGVLSAVPSTANDNSATVSTFTQSLRLAHTSATVVGYDNSNPTRAAAILEMTAIGNNGLSSKLFNVGAGETITATVVGLPAASAKNPAPALGNLLISPVKGDYKGFSAATGTGNATSASTGTAVFSSQSDEGSADNARIAAGQIATNTNPVYYFAVTPVAETSTSPAVDAGVYTIRIRLTDRTGFTTSYEATVNFVSDAADSGAIITPTVTGRYLQGENSLVYAATRNMQATVTNARGGRLFEAGTSGTFDPKAPALTAALTTSAGVVRDETLAIRDTGVAGVDHVAIDTDTPLRAATSTVLGQAAVTASTKQTANLILQDLNGTYGITSSSALGAPTATGDLLRVRYGSTSSTFPLTIVPTPVGTTTGTATFTATGKIDGTNATTLPLTTSSVTFTNTVVTTGTTTPATGYDVYYTLSYASCPVTADQTPLATTAPVKLITDSKGQASVTVTSRKTVAGCQAIVTWSGTTTAPQAQTATWAKPVATTVLASTGSYQALAKSAHTITWTVTDQFGAAVANEAVTFTASGANIPTAGLTSSVTDANGQVSFTWTDAAGVPASTTLGFTSIALNKVGDASPTNSAVVITYKATLDAVASLRATYTDGANQVLVPTTNIGGTAGRLVSAADQIDTTKVVTGAAANHWVELSFTALSSALVAVTGVPTTVTVTGAQLIGSNGKLGNSVVLYSNNKVYVLGTKTGVATVTATNGTLTSTATIKFVNAVTDARVLSLTQGNGLVTATVADAFGNGVSGVTVDVTGTGGAWFGNGATSASFKTATDGTVTFAITGAGTVTASLAEAAKSGFLANSGNALGTVITTGAPAGVDEASIVTTNEAAVAAAKAAADKAAADKASTDAAIAALKAQLDAAAAKAAADKASTDAALAAAQAAAVEAATAAADAAAEATDAANAATDAANASAEAGDAATAAAQDAADAVAALSTQVSEMIDTLKKQITALTNLVIKIQKKVKA